MSYTHTPSCRPFLHVRLHIYWILIITSPTDDISRSLISHHTMTVVSSVREMGFPHLLSKIFFANNPDDGLPHCMLCYVKFSWHLSIFDMAHPIKAAVEFLQSSILTGHFQYFLEHWHVFLSFFKFTLISDNSLEIHLSTNKYMLADSMWLHMS